jgi:hypothetical protein
LGATFPIVAWGDSLTAAGYPALAANLLKPSRSVTNKGLGGQGSYAIAARQGGQPITVSVSGNTIPARAMETVWSWDFESATGGWSGPVSRSAGKLYVTPTAAPQGAAVSLGQTIPNGRQFTVEFDIEIPAGLTVRVSGLTTGVFAANNGTGTNGMNITASGHYKATLFVGNTSGSPATMDTLCFLMTAGTPGTFSIDNVVMKLPAASTDYSVAVTAKNTNVLTSAGVYTGTTAGTLAGVHGMISTDSAGNWTFVRDAAGDAVPCPAGTIFVPDDAAAYKNHTAWIWAGNNGVASSSDAASALSDIAAMIRHLGHTRYLVLSVLTSSAFDAGRIAVLQNMNADLANIYGHRFVDVYGALRASGNGSADDTADIAAGYTPRSLRADAIHLNATGYGIVAQKVSEKMLREGW